MLILCTSFFLAKRIDKVLPRSRFTLMSGSKKFSLLMEQNTSSRVVLIVQSFSCSLSNQMNRNQGSESCKYILRVCHEILYLPTIPTGLIWYRLETVNILHGGRSQLVRKSPMQNCSPKQKHSREAATGCRTCENSCRHRDA